MGVSFVNIQIWAGSNPSPDLYLLLLPGPVSEPPLTSIHLTQASQHKIPLQSCSEGVSGSLIDTTAMSLAILLDTALKTASILCSYHSHAKNCSVTGYRSFWTFRSCDGLPNQQIGRDEPGRIQRTSWTALARSEVMSEQSTCMKWSITGLWLLYPYKVLSTLVNCSQDPSSNRHRPCRLICRPQASASSCHCWQTTIVCHSIEVAQG